MSTENDKPPNGDNQNEQPSPPAASSEPGAHTEQAASAASATAPAEASTPAPAPTETSTSAPADAPPPAASPQAAPEPASSPRAEAKSPAPAAASAPESDDEEPRGGSSDFDFGAMLDQYEQEQAAFQEGSVVRGTVVGVNDRAVVIDFGFKSEGAVPLEEFMEGGELTVTSGGGGEGLIQSIA